MFFFCIKYRSYSMFIFQRKVDFEISLKLTEKCWTTEMFYFRLPCAVRSFLLLSVDKSFAKLTGLWERMKWKEWAKSKIESDKYKETKMYRILLQNYVCKQRELTAARHFWILLIRWFVAFVTLPSAIWAWHERSLSIVFIFLYIPVLSYLFIYS